MKTLLAIQLIHFINNAIVHAAAIAHSIGHLVK